MASMVIEFHAASFFHVVRLFLGAIGSILRSNIMHSGQNCWQMPLFMIFFLKSFDLRQGFLAIQANFFYFYVSKFHTLSIFALFKTLFEENFVSYAFFQL